MSSFGGGHGSLIRTPTLRIMGKGSWKPTAEKPGSAMKGAEWNLRVSQRASSTVNPIRRITDSIRVDKNSPKPFISLAMGDPAACGAHLQVPEVVVSSLVEVAEAGHHNGYAPSTGLLESRRAVAAHLSKDLQFQLSEDDVIMTLGCSQAIQVCLDVLAFEGCNVLVPRPGFPLYESYCSFLGVEARSYPLQQEQGWEVDTAQLLGLADSNTAAIIVANPGNPCGSVYSFHHIAEIVRVAELLRLPIIADEVYSHMVFHGMKFVSLAQFAIRVPVLTLGGMSKNWLAPGWRLGWIAACDPQRILSKAKILDGLQRVMQIKAGPSTLIQAALPDVLRNTLPSFHSSTVRLLEAGAGLCYQRLKSIPGMDCPSKPQGSMFIMVRINPSVLEGVNDEIEFSRELAKEESVLVLPGSAFKLPNWFRVCFALPQAELSEAWDRIEAFCLRHSKVGANGAHH